MQVVSGPIGREKVHFEAPEAERVASEMSAFLEWFNARTAIDPVAKAAIARFWFVTIHPSIHPSIPGRQRPHRPRECRHGARMHR